MIFQRVMNTLVKGIQVVMVYLDYILVTGVTTEEHCKSLEVFSQLEKAGLWAKKNECQFMAPSVPYLGHVIDSEDLYHIAEKAKAVEGGPKPQGVHQLKSRVGLLTYYSKFLSNMTTVHAPLY